MSNQPMDNRTTIKIAGFFILVALIVITISILPLWHGTDEKNAASDALTDDDFDVVDYTYEDDSSNNVYVLVIRNNSNETVDIACNTSVYGKDDSFLGICYDAIESVAPEGYGCMQFTVDPSFAEYAARFECQFDYEISDTPSRIKSVRTSDRQQENSVIATVHNKGDQTVHGVRANILFFSKSQLVAYDTAYLANDDSLDLTPGLSAKHEFVCDQDFDSYEIYYTSK